MGTTHLVWNRGGQIWHAYYDGIQWVATGPLPGATGDNPRIIASSNLLDFSSPGAMVAWELLGTNGSALYYSVITNSPIGTNPWPSSLPQLLSDGETSPSDLDNKALALAIEPDSQVVAVWQKNQTAIVDDTDLYFKLLSFSSSQLTWPTNQTVFGATPQATVCVGGSGDLGTLSVASLGLGFGISCGYQVCFPLNLCDDTAEISGNVGLAGGPIEIQGSINGTVGYTTDPNICVYIPTAGNVTLSANGGLKVPVLWGFVGPVLLDAGFTGNIKAEATGNWAPGNFPSWPPYKITGSADLGGGVYCRGRFLFGYIATVTATGTVNVSWSYCPPWHLDSVGVRRLCRIT